VRVRHGEGVSVASNLPVGAADLNADPLTESQGGRTHAGEHGPPFERKRAEACYPAHRPAACLHPAGDARVCGGAGAGAGDRRLPDGGRRSRRDPHHRAVERAVLRPGLALARHDRQAASAGGDRGNTVHAGAHAHDCGGPDTWHIVINAGISFAAGAIEPAVFDRIDYR